MRNIVSRYVGAIALLASVTVNSTAADTVLQTEVPLTKPRKTEPRGGGSLDKVEVAIWLPDGVKVIRGAVVNPFYTKTVEQRHWQEAARLWGFAVVGANYFAVNNADYPTLLTALKEFAEKSKHPEVAHLPFCFLGMSAGAGMSMKFAETYPDRTIAVAPVCLEVFPNTDATRKIPICTVFGQKDGSQMKLITERHPEQRKLGAEWSIAVQWGRGHEYAQANNLVIPFFDDVIRARYPETDSPLNGPPKLADYPAASVWLGDVPAWGKGPAPVAAAKDFTGSKDQAAWLPGQRTARVWSAFVANTKAIKFTAPAGMGDGQPFEAHPNGKPINVAAELAASEKRAVTKVELFDGDVRLAEQAAFPLAHEAKLAPGIHSLIVVASLEGGETICSRPHTVIIQRDR